MIDKGPGVVVHPGRGHHEDTLSVRLAPLLAGGEAERAGIAGKAGSLEKGKCADVLVLDRKLAVKRVFVGGAEFGR